jgi:RHS repeat-associated protein
LDAAAAIAQAYTYSAYGQLLAIHNAAAQLVGTAPAAALTANLYSGEYFNAAINQQYLRARWYDPATGRFNRLDPFAGLLRDPQGLHKYVYCHSSPTASHDPTGLWSLSSMLSAIRIGICHIARMSARAALYAKYKALDLAYIGFVHLPQVSMWTARAIYLVLTRITLPAATIMALEHALTGTVDPATNGVFNASVSAVTALYAVHITSKELEALLPSPRSSWANYRRMATFSRCGAQVYGTGITGGTLE